MKYLILVSGNVGYTCTGSFRDRTDRQEVDNKIKNKMKIIKVDSG